MEEKTHPPASVACSGVFFYFDLLVRWPPWPPFRRTVAGRDYLTRNISFQIFPETGCNPASVQ